MRKINKNCASFIAQASHDLRQPLQALMIYLDLFDVSELSVKQKKLWEKIVTTTENLNFLLGSILDFSKIEFGNVKVNKQEVNMEILLNNLFYEYDTLAKIKKIGISCVPLKKMSYICPTKLSIFFINFTHFNNCRFNQI